VNLDDFNVIISFSILKDILKEVGNCPECNCGVTVTSDEAKRRGFAHNVEIKCASCQYSYSTYTSGTVDRNTNMTKASTKGRKTFDINLRMIVAFREIGRGHEPLISFSRIANLSCMHVNAFQNNNELIQAAYKSAATDSMKFAGSVIRENAEEKSLTGEKLVQVSLDGTWQKRGHSSLNGAVTAISNGRCIDVDVLSKYCRGCQIWNRKKHHPKYESWKANHKCSLNHEKSSGAMEGVGALNIFNRSFDSHKLIYKYYLGDGDSSSFSDVVASKLWGNT